MFPTSIQGLQLPGTRIKTRALLTLRKRILVATELGGALTWTSIGQPLMD